MKTSEFRQAVINYLAEKGKNGVLSSDIVKELKINRHTLAKHLDVLDSQGILLHRKIGMAKLWFLNKTPLKVLDKTEFDSSLSGTFAEIVYKSNSAIFVIDKDYNILFMNRAAKEITGDSNSTKCYKLFGRDSPCNKFCVVKEFLLKNIEGKQEHITEYEGKTYRTNGFTIKNPDGSLSAVEIATEITRERELEKELKEIKKIIGNKK